MLGSFVFLVGFALFAAVVSGALARLLVEAAAFGWGLRSERRRRVQPSQPMRRPVTRGIYCKLDAARKAAKAIEKHGRNEGDEYSFARAEDLVEEAKRCLSERGLLVLPAVLGSPKSLDRSAWSCG